MRVSLSLWESYERVMFFVCIGRLLLFAAGRSRATADGDHRQISGKSRRSGREDMKNKSVPFSSVISPTIAYERHYSLELTKIERDRCVRA